MKSVYVIVLNYNNYKDTLECLSGLQQLSTPDLALRLIVVDNASTDGSVAAIREALPDNATLLESEKNVGYAAGNNIGIRAAVAQNADYICVLNNDTLIPEDFITPCVRFLESQDDVGFVTPVVMEAKCDLVQSTGGDIILPRGQVSVKNNGAGRGTLPAVIPCDYVGGACMVFRAELIERIGLIPENYFLFFEETEWCYKAKQAGYRNICLNASYIRHKGSATIDTIDGLHAYLMERNRIVFMRRNCHNKAEFAFGVAYLFLRYTWWGIKKDIAYFKYLIYLKDGLLNRVNYNKYPFIIIFE